MALGVDAHDPSAYNESARKMAMDFADELGLTVTEDLGITVKTPNPDAPIYSAPGVTEPTAGTGHSSHLRGGALRSIRGSAGF